VPLILIVALSSCRIAVDISLNKLPAFSVDRFAAFSRTSHFPDAPCDQMCSAAHSSGASTHRLASAANASVSLQTVMESAPEHRAPAHYCEDVDGGVREQGHPREHVISPGPIETPILQGQFGDNTDAVREQFKTRIPMKRLGRPEEVAAAAVFLASDESSFITGIDLPVDGGVVAV